MPEPKRLEVLDGVAHNDLLAYAGERWLAVIAAWAAEILPVP